MDEIKFELYGRNTKDRDLQQQDWDVIYQEMYRRIEYVLKQGKIVVQDTGNFTKHERGLVRRIADRLHIKTATIYIDTPKEIAYKRLLSNRGRGGRFDVSDADFESTIRELEMPTAEENVLVFHHTDEAESWIDTRFR